MSEIVEFDGVTYLVGERVKNSGSYFGPFSLVPVDGKLTSSRSLIDYSANWSTFLRNEKYFNVQYSEKYCLTFLASSSKKKFFQIVVKDVFQIEMLDDGYLHQYFQYKINGCKWDSAVRVDGKNAIEDSEDDTEDDPEDDTEKLPKKDKLLLVPSTLKLYDRNGCLLI